MVEYLSVGDVARQTGLPETTVRRYATLYASYIETRRYGRSTKYAPSAVDVIRSISALYASGKETVEVSAILQGTMPQVINAAESPEIALMTSRDAQGVVALLAAQSRAIQALQDDIGALQIQRDKEHVALLEEIRALRGQIGELKATGRPSWWSRILGKN